MDHSYFKERLSAYHDNDLNNYDRQAVEEHLEQCDECRTMLADFQKLDRLVDEKSRLGESDFWEKSARRIEQAISKDKQPITDIRPRRGWLGWKLAAVAASVSIVTFIALHEEDIIKQVDQKEETRDETDSFFDDSPEGGEADLTVVGSVQPLKEEEPAPAAKAGSNQGEDRLSVPEKRTDQSAGPAPGEKPPKVVISKMSLQKPSMATGEADKKNAADEADEVVHPPSEPVASFSLPTKKKPVVYDDSAEPLQKSVIFTAQRPLIQDMAALAAKAADDLERGNRNKVELRREIAELNNLRAHRDSLRELYRSYLHGDKKRQVKDRAKENISGIQSSSITDIEEVELQLLEVWYEIGIISPDSIEAERAVDYLQTYLKRQDVNYQPLAKQYLESLKRSLQE